MIELKLLIPPFSFNKAKTMRGQYTGDARKWRANFLNQLQSPSNKKKLLSFTPLFDKQKHGLKIHFLFMQPRDKFLTKKGYISRSSMDVDNINKLPTDFLCGKRYVDPKWYDKMSNNEKILYPLSNYINLGIDDQFILSSTVEKTISPCNQYTLLIQVELLDLPV